MKYWCDQGISTMWNTVGIPIYGALRSIVCLNSMGNIDHHMRDHHVLSFFHAKCWSTSCSKKSETKRWTLDWYFMVLLSTAFTFQTVSRSELRHCGSCLILAGFSRLVSIKFLTHADLTSRKKGRPMPSHLSRRSRLSSGPMKAEVTWQDMCRTYRSWKMTRK